MSMRCLITEKSDNFNLRSDCPPLKLIFDKHEYNKITKNAVMVAGSNGGMSTAASILYDEMLLVFRTTEVDLNTAEVWKKKCKNIETLSYQALQEWAVRQDDNAAAAINLLFARKVTLGVWDCENSSKNVNKLLDARRLFQKRHNLSTETGADVPFLCMMNYASPSIFRAELQRAHMQVLSWCICDTQQSIGVVLMPVFSNVLHKTYLLDQALITKFSKHNFIFDRQFSVLFHGKTDKRDHRPLTYPGRLVFPATLGTNISKSVWCSSSLADEGRTASVLQLPSRDMQRIEDIGENALPEPASGADHDRNLSGAAKYMQIGLPACESLLSSVLTDAKLSDITGLVVVLMTPDVGDELLAFMKLCLSQTLPMHVVVMADNQVGLEWMEATVRQTLKDQVKTKDLSVAGQVPIEDKISDTEITNYLPLPAFNLLVVDGKPVKHPGSQEPGHCLPEEVPHIYIYVYIHIMETH